MAVYTAVDDSALFYNNLLYAGTGSTNAVTGVGFAPNITWIKSYDTGSTDHVLYDTVRGVEQVIYPNTNDLDSTASTGLTVFGSDGFTVVSEGNINNAARNYVAYNWKGGTTSGITTNGSTTITPSTYSFNTTSVVSILKYSGNGTNDAKVAHGLGVAPTFIMVKRTDSNGHWTVYHESMGNEYKLYLNNNYAKTDDAATWNDTTPDTVNFTLGTEADVNNSSGTYMAYCFANNQGFQRFGLYTGTGNVTGPFTYTGFRPAMLIIKRIDNTANWPLFDSKRNGYNDSNDVMQCSTSGAEASTTINLLSNGFTLDNTDTNFNTDGEPYVYMAWAQSPFVNSKGVPTNAR